MNIYSCQPERLINYFLIKKKKILFELYIINYVLCIIQLFILFILINAFFIIIYY